MGRITQSLKGSGETRWRGFADTTALAPAGGPWREAVNVTISRDGTELRPAPGTKVAGRPFYGQPFVVTVKSVGAELTTLTVDATADADTNALLTGAFYVYVPEDDEVYAAIRTGAAQFTIPTITSAVAVNDYVLVQRYGAAHDLVTVDGRAAVVLSTQCWQSTSTELTNIGTMVCSGPLSLDDPPGPGVPDETDTGFVLWPSPTMFSLNVAEIGHDVSELPLLRHYDLLLRMQADALNGRVLIAAPGLGICFEADVRRARQWLPRDASVVAYHPSPRYTKMLGIPRGHMPNAAVEDSGAGSIANGWYAFAVAYHDTYTGQVGLMSPLQVVEATGTDNSAIKVRSTRARGVAFECVGLQTILYAAGPFTAEADAWAATLEPYYAIGPFTASIDLPAQNTIGSAYTDETTFSVALSALQPIRPRRIGVLEVPLSGGSWLRVARGRAFTGGELPEAWNFEAWPKQATVNGITNYFLLLPHEWNLNTPTRGPMAWGKFPPGIAGRFVSQINTASVALQGEVRALHNAVVGSISGGLPNGGVGPHTLRVDFDPGTTSSYIADNLKDYRLITRQQAVRFSEEDAPGVAPATYELPVDALSDTITTGGARVGDNLLLFTPHQTLLFAWSSLPSFASSQVLSNRFGCAAPHSIVEFPLGAAWLSALGPCMSAGGPPLWLGESIADFWAEVLRDSTGRVICAGTAVDEATTTIYWSVRRSTSGAWTSATTDALKAMVPCDTLLAWNWTTGGLTVIERNADIKALKSMLYDDGEWRPTFATAAIATSDDLEYRPLYALSGAAERGSVVEFSATTTRDPDSALFACSGASGVVVAGDYALVRSANGEQLRWFGTVASVSPSGVVLNDADGCGWLGSAPPDVLVARCVAHASLRTHRARLGLPGMHSSVERVVIVARIDADHAYAKVTGTANDGSTVTWPAVRLVDGTTVLSGEAYGDDVELLIEIAADGDFGIKEILVEGEAGRG